MNEVSATGVTIPYDERQMRRLPVDVEHLGVRVIVPLLAVAALALVLVLGPVGLAALDLEDTVASSLLLPLAILAAIGAALLGDRLLKKYWPSGRELLVDESCLVLRDRKKPEQVLRWGERVNLLTWRFTVPRRGRVPKGYLCLAMQLLQDEQQITIYTFYDPKKLDRLEKVEAFTPLVSRRTLQEDRLNLRVAGQQRRLLQAEDERWQNGAELVPEDFAALWRLVCRQTVVKG